LIGFFVIRFKVTFQGEKEQLKSL